MILLLDLDALSELALELVDCEVQIQAEEFIPLV
jgi:hypothetical protein